MPRRLFMLCLLALFTAAPLHAADYTVITLQVEVNRPADAVWQRVGPYCAIAEWLKATCDYASGSGALGSVRRINGANVEPMVGQTPHSYTYWQSAGNMAPYNYHGTLAVEPITATRSRLIYTLFYDQSLMPSDAVRASEHARLAARFQTALETMKSLAESK